MSIIFQRDFYKTGHHAQYPEGTELIFSNFTPRKSRMPGVDYSVFFGLKYFIKKYLMGGNSKVWDHDLHLYLKLINDCLGKQDISCELNLEALGHLPLAIYALPEGSIVPQGVPALVVYNTDKKFAWMTNAIETIMSCTLWGSCTSATIAREYRLILDKYAELTSDNAGFVDYQAHDFSFRGMFGLEAAVLSGAAHLQYFKGTDSIPAILMLHDYYDSPLSIGSSVPATEHSVSSASIQYIKDQLDKFGEYNGFKVGDFPGFGSND